MSLVLLRYFSKIIRNNYYQFERFFNEAETGSMEIDKQKLSFQEFRTLADAANKMTAFRKQADQELHNRLIEKETLLKEIHHRVKNNLQIISSLMSLELAGIKSVKQKKMFQESVDRVRVMALIHEHLYESEDLSKLIVSIFFEQLVNDLVMIYSSGTGKPDIKMNIPDIALTIDKTIPLGLIVSEIVTNSFKYAQKEDSALEIRITLVDLNGYVELILSDNGAGFKDNFDPKEQDSLALQLIFSLAEQLNAEIQWKSEAGLEWIFRIPV